MVFAPTMPTLLMVDFIRLRGKKLWRFIGFGADAIPSTLATRFYFWEGDTFYDLEAGQGGVVDLGGNTAEGLAEIGIRYIVSARDSGFENGACYDVMREGESGMIYRLEAS